MTLHIHHLGKRIGKTLKVGSRMGQRALRIGGRIASVGSEVAEESGRPGLAAELGAVSKTAHLGAHALQASHHAARSELEKKR